MTTATPITEAPRTEFVTTYKLPPLVEEAPRTPVEFVRTTVAVAGGFDPLHDGHIAHIEEALQLGSELLIILTRDDQLIAKKGFYAVPYEVRKAVLEWGLKSRGVVVVNKDEDLTSTASLRRYRPHIFAKGGDTWDFYNLPEREVCKELGIQVYFGVGGFEKLRSSTEMLKSYEK